MRHRRFVTIAVYLCPIRPGDEAHIEALLATLDDDERARAARFVFAADRLAFAAAHVLLHRALDRIAGEAHAWRFGEGPFGKPMLDPPFEDIRFNLSHTRGAVAVVVTRGCELGVDIESDRHIDEPTFHSQILAPVELADLDGFEDREARLTALWVAKEAIVKAIGTGLSLPVTRVIVRGDPLALVALPGEYGLAAEWTLSVERLGSHWCGLAWRGPRTIIERTLVSIADLSGALR